MGRLSPSQITEVLGLVGESLDRPAPVRVRKRAEFRYFRMALRQGYLLRMDGWREGKAASDAYYH